MQNPLNCGMSGCQNYPIRITPLCRRQWVLVFLAFVVLREKINFKIKTLGRREKREEAGPKRKQFNDVCKVCQVNLKVTYGNPSARKQIFGVVLSEFLKSFGITVIASYIDSQLACIACSCLNCMRLIYNTSHQTASE